MSDFATVFDLDGTLVDTEEVWDAARRELAAQDGVPWPDGATQAMMGMSTQEWSHYLAATVGIQGDDETAARRVIDALKVRYHHQLDILPGAVEAVRRMAELGPVGIASSSPRELIEALVRELGLTDVIQVIVSTEEVGRGKPAPDGFLAACAKLGATPRHTVAVEDSTNGIRSGLAAGMPVVAVPQDFHRPPQDLLDACSAVLPDLDGLTPELVNRILQPGRDGGFSPVPAPARRSQPPR